MQSLRLAIYESNESNPSRTDVMQARAAAVAITRTMLRLPFRGTLNQRRQRQLCVTLRTASATGPKSAHRLNRQRNENDGSEFRAHGCYGCQTDIGDREQDVSGNAHLHSHLDPYCPKQRLQTRLSLLILPCFRISDHTKQQLGKLGHAISLRYLSGARVALRQRGNIQLKRSNYIFSWVANIEIRSNFNRRLILKFLLITANLASFKTTPPSVCSHQRSSKEKIENHSHIKDGDYSSTPRMLRD